MTVGGLVWGLLGNPGKGKRERQEKSAEGEARKGDDEPYSWVRVTTVYTPGKAEFASVSQHDEGIPVRLSQNASTISYPLNVSLLGQIYIPVTELLHERAELVN